MADDEELAHRVREQLADETSVTDGSDAALARPHTRIFDMTGRPMKGWILVASEGARTKRQLSPWVRRGVEFARTLPPKE